MLNLTPIPIQFLIQIYHNQLKTLPLTIPQIQLQILLLILLLLTAQPILQIQQAMERLDVVSLLKET